MPETLVYIALGSNLGTRLAYLEKATRQLAFSDDFTLLATSFVYDTAPLGVSAQNRFLNAALRGKTSLSPAALLSLCMEIEKSLGRTRTRAATKTPRTIDLDILLYGTEIINDPTLTIPHPEMQNRAFVLAPLADVAAPKLRHPLSGAPLDHFDPAQSMNEEIRTLDRLICPTPPQA